MNCRCYPRVALLLLAVSTFSCATALDDTIDAGSGPTPAPTSADATDAPRLVIGVDSGGGPVVIVSGDSGTHDATTAPVGDATKAPTSDATSVPDVSTHPDVMSMSMPDTYVAPTPDAGHDAGMPTVDSGSSVIPTTCAGAYQGEGCCGPDGKVYYCTMGGTVGSMSCTGTKVCGWKGGTTDEYDCVNPPAEADPSGANPIDCK
jgi:hypothetical protein